GRDRRDRGREPGLAADQLGRACGIVFLAEPYAQLTVVRVGEMAHALADERSRAVLQAGHTHPCQLRHLPLAAMPWLAHHERTLSLRQSRDQVGWRSQMRIEATSIVPW